MAILAPVMIGGLALGAEFGYWQLKKRQLQNAADMAAYAAGTQLRNAVAQSALETAALKMAKESGFDASRGVISVQSPPAAGAFAGNANAVRVTLSQSVDRSLSKVFTKEPLSLPAAATAVIQNGRPACVLALDPTADDAIEVTGSADVTLNGCDVAANSTSNNAFQQKGNGKMSVDCISTVGGASIQKSGNITLKDCDKAIEHTPVTPDPYAYRAAPANYKSLACTSSAEWTKNNGKPLSGKKYCGGAVINKSVTVQVDPNNPWVVLSGGTWKFNGGSFVGKGVTLFLTNNAELDINGNADFELTAPTSGNFSGLAVFFDRDDTNEHKFNGGADISIVGAIYGAKSRIEMLGNIGGGAGECTQLVAGTIKFTGNSGWSVDCSKSGTADISVAQTLALAE